MTRSQTLFRTFALVAYGWAIALWFAFPMVQPEGLPCMCHHRGALASPGGETCMNRLPSPPHPGPGDADSCPFCFLTHCAEAKIPPVRIAHVPLIHWVSCPNRFEEAQEAPQQFHPDSPCSRGPPFA